MDNHEYTFFLANHKSIRVLLLAYPLLKSVTANSGNIYAIKVDKGVDDLIKYMIEIVDSWLNQLYSDEREIIELRYFKDYSYNHIAIECRYKSHSSVWKKEKRIISKIRKAEINNRKDQCHEV